MDKTQFHKLADQYILKIERIIEQNDDKEYFDVDNKGELLSIVYDEGEYVINKHEASLQIWLSSPVSGPAHYKYNGKDWVNTRDDKDILYNKLISEISDIMGKAIS